MKKINIDHVSQDVIEQIENEIMFAENNERCIEDLEQFPVLVSKNEYDTLLYKMKFEDFWKANWEMCRNWESQIRDYIRESSISFDELIDNDPLEYYYEIFDVAGKSLEEIDKVAKDIIDHYPFGVITNDILLKMIKLKINP